MRFIEALDNSGKVIAVSDQVIFISIKHGSDKTFRGKLVKTARMMH